MAQQQIRFEDGAAYERMMGSWSRLVGEIFIDWLAPRSGLRWIDVGCGNGAFTELLVERCAPAEIHGIDPSEGQLAFARTRPAARLAEFRRGDAMTLPFSENRFDAAVMALVIFFLSDPRKGLAEMVRVVRPGGSVAAYAWDIEGGGFPLEPFRSEMHVMGISLPIPPSSGASQIGALEKLWKDAGIEAVETRTIQVQRTFADFNEFWTVSLGSSVGQTVARMQSSDVELLKARMRARVPVDAAGRITYGAHANAVKGQVPS
jgi:ubiquinone/menaquinone biosynthesis C-methylase UbiE